MRIAIGSDHAGYRLKEHLIQVLHDGGHDVVDLGTDSEEPVDYPPICAGVGREVAAGRAERGSCSAGAVRASRSRRTRCAVCAPRCATTSTPRSTRAGTTMPTCCRSARVVGEGLADEILRVWLTTAFEGGRHQRRVNEIHDIEGSE